MSIMESPQAKGLTARVQNILMKPAAEWDVIEPEAATVPGLYMGYIGLIALLPVIGEVVGSLRHGPLAVLGGLVVGAILYGLILGLIYVQALVADMLAPSFDGQKSPIQALKLIGYSYTAVLVSGVFFALTIIPILGGFIAGLIYLAAVVWGCYILYLGVPKIMKVPADKSIGYTIVVALIGGVMVGIAFWIVVLISAMALVGAAVTGGAMAVGSGNTHVNVSQLAVAGQQIAAAEKQAQSGDANAKVVAIDPNTLKGLLPDTVAGAARTEVSAASGGAGGIGGSTAEATYQKGDARVTVTVVDLASMGGMAALAGAANIQSDQETATGYEKVSTVNGRMTTEKYDNTSKSGEYSVIVANRFTVSAEGSGVTIDDLKAAVAAVGPDRLQGMAHS